MIATRKTMVFAAVAGAAAVGVLVAALNRANERRFRDLEREIRATAEERRQTEADEARRPPVVVWAPPAAPPAVPEAAPAAATNATGGPAQAEQAVPSEAEYALDVGNAFSRESREVAWAQDTERSIGSSLRALAETSVVQAVECRRDLCRASVRHLDGEKFSAFIDRLVARANETWGGEIYWNRDAGEGEGAVQSTMYFGKPGLSIHSLALAE